MGNRLLKHMTRTRIFRAVVFQGMTLLIALIWLYRWTLRVTIRDPHRVLDRLDEVPTGAAVVWHNRLLCSAFLFPRRLRERTVVLASKSQDGDYSEHFFRRMGCRVVRGSSSRGGREALLALRRGVRDGAIAIITPDGPRGPRYSVKPGVVLLAQKSGTAIVPFLFAAPRRWEFSGWDRAQLPKPFSRVELIIGDFLFIPPDCDARTEGCTLVANHLAALTDDARR